MSVQHLPMLRRFVRDLPDGPAFIEYETAPGALEITHTFVPPTARGQGIAEALMEAVIAHASQQNLRLIPTCSYAARYLARKASAQT